MYISNDSFNLHQTRLVTPISVETFLEQGSGELCEDVLLEAGDIFGVFDGATSLDKAYFSAGRTGGLFAAELAASSFRRGEGSLLQSARRANQDIRCALEDHDVNIAERHRLWSTSLAVVKINGENMEYCQTGDAHILMIYGDGSHKVITPEVDIDRETLQLWKEQAKGSCSSIQRTLGDQIKAVRLQMNRSYGVLNGEVEALDFIHHDHLDLTGVTDILLFTDGLFLPKENPGEENDWSFFVELYTQGGLQTIRNYVRRLQLEDPQLYTYPRFKMHDDIAAVAIHLQ